MQCSAENMKTLAELESLTLPFSKPGWLDENLPKKLEVLTSLTLSAGIGWFGPKIVLIVPPLLLVSSSKFGRRAARQIDHRYNPRTERSPIQSADG